MKVGTNRESDLRRGKIVRSVIDDPANLPANAKPRDPATLVGKNAGPTGSVLMIDANQVWDVPQAIEYVKSLQEIKPWFIEEPTAPDDILGHAAIRKALKPFGIGVATGEHAHNRMVFKQLMQVRGIAMGCTMGYRYLFSLYDRRKRLMWRRLIHVASLVSAKS
jgi:L-fuconate dehydratase